MHSALNLAVAAVIALPSITHAQVASVSSMPAIKLTVRDFSRSAAFYGALGMRQGGRHNDHETSLSWEGPAQGSAIVMVRESNAKMSKGGASLVINVPDMTVALSRLKSAGFEQREVPRTVRNYSMLVIADPDGNRVELLSRTAP
jgi:predicted enzyme related to lactoylglutathione lyase